MANFNVHFISFKAGDGYSCTFGNHPTTMEPFTNLQSWHLDLVEQWVKDQRAALEACADDGMDLV